MDYVFRTTGRMLTGWDGNLSVPTTVPHAIAAPPGPGAETLMLASGNKAQGGSGPIPVGGFATVLLCLHNLYAGVGASSMTFRVYGNIHPDTTGTYRELLSTVAGVTNDSFDYVSITNNTWNFIEITVQETLLVASDPTAAAIVFCNQAH